LKKGRFSRGRGAWIKERSNKKGGEEREKKMMENQFMRQIIVI
jgi:hypothetical protein